jgi:putative salt-induced outer membrane protein
VRASQSWFPWIILLFIGSATGRVSAQAPAEPEPRVQGQAELSLVSATGNSDTQTFGAGAELDYRPDRWHVLLKANGVHSSSADTVQAESLSALGRATRALGDGVEVFGQTGYLRNRFSGIANRIAAEGGMSYVALPDDRAHALRVAGGVGFIREDHVATETVRFATASLGARYRWRISDHSELGDEASLLWNLASAADWRSAQAVTLTAAIAEGLSLKLMQQVEFRHRPEPGFRRTDTLTSVALVVAF